MIRAIALTSIFCGLSACSLFGPPLPPAPLDPAIAEHEARPTKLLDAFIGCTRDYGKKYGGAEGVVPDMIADAALTSCQREFNDYRAVVTERAKSQPRILGWISTSGHYTEQTVEEAEKLARAAAIAAIIETRATQ